MFFRQTIRTNTNGLVGWWPFDNNTPQDFSGNPKVNGTLVAGPQPCNGIAYSVNKQNRRGFLLNGSSQYITFTNSISLEWNTAQGVTMMARVYFNGLANAYTQCVGYGLIGDGASFFDMFVKSNGKTAVYARYLGSAQPNYDGTGSATLSTGKWYHLAATVINVSGTVTVKGYVNGVLDGTASNSVPLANSGCTFVTGNDLAFAGRFLNGITDDVRVYRGVLSAQEIFDIAQEPYVAGEVDMPVLFVPPIPPSILYGHNIGASFTRKVTTIGY